MFAGLYLMAVRLQSAAYMLLAESTEAARKTDSTDAFGEMSRPIIGLLNKAVVPAISLVGAIGAIYCVLLGAKLAKADEPQEREKAKAALKNALVGFILIFVLLVALHIGTDAMTNWYKEAIK